MGVTHEYAEKLNKCLGLNTRRSACVGGGGTVQFLDKIYKKRLTAANSIATEGRFSCYNL